jgi:hypothetical protein
MVRLIEHSVALIGDSYSGHPKCSSNILLRTLVRSISWLPYSCLLACLCLTGASCGNLKVKLPTSDSTPPSLVWNVFNHGSRQQADYPGSPTVNVKRGERYRVILKAKDPEGVKSIQINPSLGDGEMWWQCIDPPGGENLAQNKTATLGPMTQNLAPDPDGKVLTSIFLIFEMDFTMDCQVTWSFASGGAKLTGRASNYFGGAKTEVIKFIIAP